MFLFFTDLVISCMWVSEELLCDVKKGFTLFPHQIDYEITFGIPSHKPGTFRCDYIPSDKAVTVQSCNLTLKGEALHPVVTRVHRDREFFYRLC